MLLDASSSVNSTKSLDTHMPPSLEEHLFQLPQCLSQAYKVGIMVFESGFPILDVLLSRKMVLNQTLHLWVPISEMVMQVTYKAYWREDNN